MQPGYAALGLEPLQDVPVIACTPAPRTCRATELPLGELAIEIEGDAPTDVVVRCFAYPFWQIDPPRPLAATEPLRLLAFTSPRGIHAYRLTHLRPLAEKIGWIVSGLSLVVFLATAVMAGRARPIVIR